MATDPRSTTTPTKQPTETTDDSAEEEYGRIGYGRYARYTPVALALLIVVTLLAIGIWQRRPGEGTSGAGRLVGKPAPEATLTLFDGSALRLADLRDSVVVLNFWASWCAPCEDELPRFQALSEEWESSGEPVRVVGVGVKRDYGEGARQMAEQLGLTFPVGRDTAGDSEVLGPIQSDYGVSTLPTTFFIRPDGTVAAVHIGEMSEQQIREYVALAKSEE
ncbi:MAG TPA: redoxin domain-containing protein [Thermomicrobiales bacterium]